VVGARSSGGWEYVRRKGTILKPSYGERVLTKGGQKKEIRDKAESIGRVRLERGRGHLFGGANRLFDKVGKVTLEKGVGDALTRNRD